MKIISPILTAILVIIVMFVIVSIADVVLSVISRRFYSTAAFIVIFGVGGIFAAIFSYSYGMGVSEKNTMARWMVVCTIIISGLLFFFPLSAMEGGEYEPAFKAYGVSLVLGTLLAAKAKVEV